MPEIIPSKPRSKFDLSIFTETIGALVLGVTLHAMKLDTLANVSFILGPLLSTSRFLLTQTIERELGSVHSLTAVVDLQRQLEVQQLQDIVRVYLEITEHEFRPVKNRLLEEAAESLKKLARQKISDVLATGEYYSWLLPILGNASPGSRIWAVSMMLDVEWDDSPYEERFLDLNIAAAKRGVILERVFVVQKSHLAPMLENKGVKAHLEGSGEFLRPFVVVREHLVKSDPQLLRDLGDGFISFDERVALIEKSSPDGMRGHVTMSATDIHRLKHIFERLRSFGQVLNKESAARLSAQPAGMIRLPTS